MLETSTRTRYNLDRSEENLGNEQDDFCIFGRHGAGAGRSGLRRFQQQQRHRFVVSNATDGLEDGKGRVFVAHGANDSLLNPVDIILTDEGACPPPLLDQLEFEQVKPDGGLDLDEATYNLGFDLNPGDCTAEVSFSAPVTPGVTTIVVAVDEDTTDESLSPQVWAIINASDAPVALIEQ